MSLYAQRLTSNGCRVIITIISQGPADLPLQLHILCTKAGAQLTTIMYYSYNKHYSIIQYMNIQQYENCNLYMLC